MKKMYSKPTITETDVMEGVYMASGDTCYTTTAYIHQKPQEGRGDYRIQVNGKHHATHTKEHQQLHITFNMPVEYGSSNGSLVSGNGTTTLVISYGYHQNPNDNIGLGDLCVKADPGLAISSVYITD